MTAEQLETVPCPLCGGSRHTVRLRQRDVVVGVGKGEYTIVRCLDCEFLYLNPRPTLAALAQYYPERYYTTGTRRTRAGWSADLKATVRERYFGYPTAAPRPWWWRAAAAVEHVHLKAAGRHLLPYRGQGRVLDVGCGPGEELAALREIGWTPHGVDMSSTAVAQARARGIAATVGTLKSAAFPAASFDTVLFTHALEHVPDPVETLREAHRILAPGGLARIRIPNAASMEARLFGRWWIGWDVPRHLMHFTPQSARRALAAAGFADVTIRHSISSALFRKSLDLYGSHRLGIGPGLSRASRHVVAGPLCRVAGHLGFGGELLIDAVKA